LIEKMPIFITTISYFNRVRNSPVKNIFKAF